MPTVKIKSLVQGGLSNEEYSWILRHLFEPIPVMSLTYWRTTGALWHIAIFCESPDPSNLRCITLFVRDNQLCYELEGLQP